MSFRWPELLWAVLLVPLVLLVWMRGERRRTQRAGDIGAYSLLGILLLFLLLHGPRSRCERPPPNCPPAPPLACLVGAQVLSKVELFLAVLAE